MLPSPNCQCEMSPEPITKAVESESDVEVDESVEIHDAADEDEAEVVESISHTGQEIRGWDVLRDEFEVDLKKKAATLPLSKINQAISLRFV